MSETPEFHVETGRVVEVRRGRAIVELESPAGAGARPECARCGLCSALAGSRAGAPPELLAAVPPGLELAPGDRVELRIRLANPGVAATLLLGLPLAAFLAASLAAFFLWKSERLAAALGFAALAGAYLALFLHDRARGPRARIERKL